MSGIRLLLSSLNECIIKFPPSTYIILRVNKTLYMHYYLLLIILSSQNSSIGYCNWKKLKCKGPQWLAQILYLVSDRAEAGGKDF